jgi:nucleoside-diphosphate-sugar epimerase
VNIASGVCLPLRDMIGRIADQIGRPELVRLGVRPTPASEPPRPAAATHRLRNEVGFHPSRTLDEGLAETIAWWRDTIIPQR